MNCDCLFCSHCGYAHIHKYSKRYPVTGKSRGYHNVESTNFPPVSFRQKQDLKGRRSWVASTSIYLQMFIAFSCLHGRRYFLTSRNRWIQGQRTTARPNPQVKNKIEYFVIVETFGMKNSNLWVCVVCSKPWTVSVVSTLGGIETKTQRPPFVPEVAPGFPGFPCTDLCWPKQPRPQQKQQVKILTTKPNARSTANCQLNHHDNM